MVIVAHLICLENVEDMFDMEAVKQKVRKSSYRKRNTKHTPTSQAMRTHTHTDTHMPPTMQ